MGNGLCGGFSPLHKITTKPDGNEIEFRQAALPGDDADSIKKALLQPASSGKEELHEKDTDPQKKADVLFSNEGIGNHRIKAGES